MAPGCPTVGIWLRPAERWLPVLLSSSRIKGWEGADQQRGRSVAGGVEPARATPAPARCWVSSDGPFLPLAVWQQQLLFPDHYVSVWAAPLTPGTVQPAPPSAHHSQPRGGGLCAQAGAHRLPWEIKPCWPRVEPGDIKTGFVVKQAGVVLVLWRWTLGTEHRHGSSPSLTRLKWMQSRTKI